jgi:hypothetical protein
LAFYKRSVFLINPGFQIKFSLIVCSIVIVATMIYPFIIYDFFDLIIQNEPSLSSTVLDARKDMILYLGLIQIVITLLVLFIFIFLTHKIAGPL